MLKREAPTTPIEKTMEEKDHLIRSNKKVKSTHDEDPTDLDMQTDDVMVITDPLAQPSMEVGEEEDHMIKTENPLMEGNTNSKGSSPKMMSYGMQLMEQSLKIFSLGMKWKYGLKARMLDSQNLDLNEDPMDEDPLMPVINFPKQLITKIHSEWRDCLIIRLLGNRLDLKLLKPALSDYGVCKVTLRWLIWIWDFSS